MNTLLLSMAMVVGAPGPKEQPKSPTMVGKWVVESIRGKAGGASTDDMSFEFTAEGQWQVYQGVIEITPLRKRFKEDPTASPMSFDAYFDEPGEKPSVKPSTLGIYKIEGDTLTIVYGEERPTKFAVPKSGPGTMVELKRAKKKD